MMKQALRSLSQLTVFQFRSLYRNKVAFFFNLMFPLLMVATFGLLFGGSGAAPGDVSVGWLDQDGGAVAEALSEALQATGYYTLKPGDATTLETMLRDGDIRAALIIPQGLSETALSEVGVGSIRVLFDPVSPSSSRVMQELQQFVASVDARMQGARPRFAVHPEVLPEVEGISTFDYLIPGQFVVMLLSAGMVTVSISMAIQRRSGALRHLFSTPLSIGGWAGSRALANIVMAALQGTILFIFAGLLFGVAPPANLLGTAGVVLVSTLASLSMGMLFGTLVSGEGAALAITMPFFMIMLFLGNAAMPLQDPPAVVAAIMPYVPAYHMTEALRPIMMQGEGIATAWPQLAVLSGIAAVCMSVAMWRLRRQYVVVG